MRSSHKVEIIMENNQTREFLRHTLATVAYRGGKAIADAPENFADFKAAETTRTPLQILTHNSECSTRRSKAKVITALKSKSGASAKINRQTASSSIES